MAGICAFLPLHRGRRRAGVRPFETSLVRYQAFDLNHSGRGGGAFATRAFAEWRRRRWYGVVRHADCQCAAHSRRQVRAASSLGDRRVCRDCSGEGWWSLVLDHVAPHHQQQEIQQGRVERHLDVDVISAAFEHAGEGEGFMIAMLKDHVGQPFRLALGEVITTGLGGEGFDEPAGVADFGAVSGS
jgi:hypothetical protein